MSGDGRDVALVVHRKQGGLQLAALARRYRRAPQTLKGEMQRHHNDPSSAALFAVDLEGLLGPNVWERMTAGDARANGLQDT